LGILTGFKKCFVLNQIVAFSACFFAQQREDHFGSSENTQNQHLKEKAKLWKTHLPDQGRAGAPAEATKRVSASRRLRVKIAQNCQIMENAPPDQRRASAPAEATKSISASKQLMVKITQKGQIIEHAPPRPRAGRCASQEHKRRRASRGDQEHKRQQAA